ncbi:MAG: class I SAM-dependent methyltransferase [Pseudomonadota bacterium]
MNIVQLVKLFARPQVQRKKLSVEQTQLKYPEYSDEIKNFEDYINKKDGIDAFYADQAVKEKRFYSFPNPVEFEGFCRACNSNSVFTAIWDIKLNDIYGEKCPVWRERLKCTNCRLTGRMRLSAHELLELASSYEAPQIYMTEQTTPLFRFIKKNQPRTTGSEYLAEDKTPGSFNIFGTRHEDVTALSFAENRFDILASFEVLEHVPDYKTALAEFFRVLKPGGKLVATFPFRKDIESTIVRATRDENGEITHLLEPEYHGDPIKNSGILCYYHFGWDIISEMSKVGFSNIRFKVRMSIDHGYMGAGFGIFLAEK